MADFEQAHRELEQKEGVGRDGYNVQANDLGGETCNGISRRFFPSSPIWPVVERLKRLPGFPGTLDSSAELRTATLATYRAAFWDAYGLGWIEDQQVAAEIYEQLVNLGPGGGGRTLQRALNLLNVKGDGDGNDVELWPQVKVDGDPGEKTHQALAACIKAGRADALFNTLNVLQGMRYVERAEQDATQKAYACGWMRRVDAYRRKP